MESNKFTSLAPIHFNTTCDPNPTYTPEFAIPPVVPGDDKKVAGLTAAFAVLGGGAVGIAVLSVLILVAFLILVVVIVTVVCCIVKRKKKAINKVVPSSDASAAVKTTEMF